MTYEVLLMKGSDGNGIRVFDDSFIVGTAWSDPDAIIVRSQPVDTDKYKKLFAVARAGAGVDAITVEKATKRGIAVFNTPGSNANAVAELVFIMIGLYARNVSGALRFVQSFAQFMGTDEEIRAYIEKGKSNYTGFELVGKTLGVIGLGNIGLRVANRGLLYGMRVVGYDSLPTVANMHQLDARVEIVHRLEDVVSCADIVSVHVPLMSSTRNLIGENEIGCMKRGVILMNYAREGIYNDAAVLASLASHHVRAYLTDFPTHTLIGNDSVVCTPHLGASTVESTEKSFRMAADKIRDYLMYGVVSHSVNFPTVAVMPRRSTKTRITVVNRDVPKMISKITRTLGAAGVNIQSMTNESNGVIGYNVIDVDVPVSDNVITMIERVKDVLRVRMISL